MGKKKKEKKKAKKADKKAGDDKSRKLAKAAKKSERKAKEAAEAVWDLFHLHRIGAPLPEMKAQIRVLVHAAGQTEQALAALPRMDRDTLEPYWIEINRLENEGDKLYRRAVADLFSGDHKAMDVLKWKEVIENLEEAIDGHENVANIIESIVVKNA